jgi:hypothetical protein
MPKHMPYSIAHRRDLSGEEKVLLRFLLDREAPNRVSELESLKIVARCGCGTCPTILFAHGTATEPTTAGPMTEVASYRGLNAEGVTVGVVLIDRGGRLAELESWSPEGNDITSWPPPSALERFAWK